MAASAANNAALCEAVCRTHGLTTSSERLAWTSARRTPLLYPDAVTLQPECSADQLLGRIDSRPGCSIKDSFASLELADAGFSVLFEAEWIHLPDKTPTVSKGARRWQPVREHRVFTLWEKAWRGSEGPTRVLLPEIIEDESVTVLARRSGDQVAAGAVLFHAAGVVGISNVFSVSGDERRCWTECIGSATELHPGSTLVGYESGAGLRAALGAGFSSTGPLRVWLRKH